MSNQTNIDGLRGQLALTIHRHWKLFLIQGIVMMVLGFLAVAEPNVATVAVTLFVGWLFFIGGIFRAASAWHSRQMSPFCRRAETGWMQKRHRTISSSVANRGCGEFFQFYKKEDGSFAGLLAVAVGKKLEPADAGNRVFCQHVNAVGALCCRRTRILCLREPSVGPWARRKSGRSNARSAPRSGRWALLRMRNAKPAAKESCLYDHALTSISRARSCSVGWVEGSCEVRRSQMAAVALRNIQGTPRRRVHAKAIYLSSKPFWKE